MDAIFVRDVQPPPLPRVDAVPLPGRQRLLEHRTDPGLSGSGNIKPDLIADVTLYPTSQGGLKGPTPTEWFGCPCMVDEDGSRGWDCRLLLDGRSMSPGETRRVGISFLSGEKAAQLFRIARKFYLWEMRIIGEAIVISD